jgi:hypothetical protein
MFDLRHFAARYSLGLLDVGSLVEVADILVNEGHTEPSVIELLVLNAPTMVEAAPIFERACAELGFPVPPKSKAVDILLQSYLEPIASGAILPHDGLAVIMREVYFPYVSGEPCKKYVGDSHGIEHLIGAYWAYDDLIDTSRGCTFDGKSGAEAIASWEQSVRHHARDWLEKHAHAA